MDTDNAMAANRVPQWKAGSTERGIAKQERGRGAPLMVMMENALFDGDMERAMVAAKVIAHTNLVPKDYRGKPQEVIVGVEYARQLGIDSPLLALANISNINGRPALFGDLPLALIQKHPQYVDIDETQTETEAICVIRRVNSLKEVRETSTAFSVEDAKRAGLWGKGGPWTNYPRRMLQMRARALCIRDSFADALHGFCVEASNESEAAVEVVVEEPRQATPVITVEKHDANGPLTSGVATAEAVKEEVASEPPRIFKNKSRRPANPSEGDIWWKGGDVEDAWTFQGGEWTQVFQSNQEMHQAEEPEQVEPEQVNAKEPQIFRCSEGDINAKQGVVDDDIWIDTDTGQCYSSWRGRWVKGVEEYRLESARTRIAELVAAASRERGWGKEELIDHCDMTLGVRPEGLLKLSLMELHELTLTIPEA